MIMITRYVAAVVTIPVAAVLVMLPAVIDSPGRPQAPVPPVGTVALSESADPAADPVGDLLREIGRRKLREEMIKALNEARAFGREPAEVFLYRSQNPDAVPVRPIETTPVKPEVIKPEKGKR